MTLSKHSQKVQDALSRFGMDLKVLELPDSTRTAKEAAAAIGCQVGQIVKSLIFRNDVNPILILVSGDNQLDTQVFERDQAIKLQKADANFVKASTGFSIGGVPPIGHNEVIDTYIDQGLVDYDLVWAAAGMPFSVFAIPGEKLVDITNGQVIAVK